MKKFALGCALSLSTLFGAGVASAQQVSYAVDHFPACTTDVASGGGKAFAIGCDADPGGSIWTRNSTGWQEFAAGTQAKQVVVSQAGTPWILKSNDSIYKWNGSAFERKGTSTNCFTDLAVGFQDTDAWAIGCSGRVYRYNGSSWVQPDSAARALKIAVGTDNVPWVLIDNQVFKWDGTSFQWFASDTTVIGGAGWVVGTNEGNNNDIWRLLNGNWDLVHVANQPVTQLTGDGLFAQLQDGTVLALSRFEFFQAHGTQTSQFRFSFRGRHFSPTASVAVSWIQPSGQPFVLNSFNPLQSGVVEATDKLAITDCGILNSKGLRRSSGPQTISLSQSGRSATIVNDVSLRNACSPFLNP